MIVKKHRLILLAAGIVTLLAAAPAFAATWTWTGAAGNNSWNNSGNWNPVVQPAINGTADIIFGMQRHHSVQCGFDRWLCRIDC
jgi:hypothetical protein